MSYTYFQNYTTKPDNNLIRNVSFMCHSELKIADVNKRYFTSYKLSIFRDIEQNKARYCKN